MKRGRPKLYATEEERKAAQAEAKRKKRAGKRKRLDRMRERRRLQGATWVPVVEYPREKLPQLREELRFAIEDGWSKEAIKALEEQIEAIEGQPDTKEMEEYDQQIARQEARDERANAVTLDDLLRGAGLRDGMYIADAPQGKGLLDFRSDVATVSDAQEGRKATTRNGHRVRPKGFGIKNHENGDARKDPEETEEQWINKHFHWTSLLECYRPGCRRLVIGILPEDIDKPRDKCRYHCDLHTPIHE